MILFAGDTVKAKSRDYIYPIVGTLIRQRADNGNILIGVTSPTNFRGHNGNGIGESMGRTNWHDKCWWITLSEVILVNGKAVEHDT